MVLATIDFVLARVKFSGIEMLLSRLSYHSKKYFQPFLLINDLKYLWQ